MELSEAIERCKELIKSEHDRWIGLTNQEAICVVLRELESARKFIDEEEETIVEKNNKICELEYKLANSISKDKIKEKIVDLKVKLEDVSKRREEAKEQEEQAVLWCIEIRLDERIKAYEELLKGE